MPFYLFMIFRIDVFINILFSLSDSSASSAASPVNTLTEMHSIRESLVPNGQTVMTGLADRGGFSVSTANSIASDPTHFTASAPVNPLIYSNTSANIASYSHHGTPHAAAAAAASFGYPNPHSGYHASHAAFTASSHHPYHTFAHHSLSHQHQDFLLRTGQW